MNDNIMNQSQFIEKGENYTGVVKEKVDLDDEFTITYSSGSTNSSRPKAIVHKLRSYITMGTFHEPKVSNTPSMKNMRVLAHIPTHSNTNIMSCITDSLIEEATVCLEPIYDKDFFHSSLQINKPTFACATRSFWVNLSKIVIKLNKYNVNVKLPFLLVPMSVGEPLSRGEEELANKMCKLTDAGIEKTHTPKSVVTMSVAGGDCEHGGIFFIVFRNLMKKLKRMNDEDYDILRTYSMVDLAVLDADGNICKNGEIGRLYAKSPCNMKEYRNNPEANAKFFKEINGEIYGDCSVYGYIDDKGYIHVKGRINESCKAIPPFKISEEISKDTRNILSCETIEHGDDDITYACHIELQPETNADVDKVLFSALCRVKEALGNDVAEKVVFRVRNNVESFPLTDCGKRSNKKLEYEELENCVKVSLENNQIVMSPVEKRDENAKELIKNNMGFLK